jgi:hypothetical protein
MARKKKEALSLDDFRIIEENIDISLQKEYLEISKAMASCNLSSSDVLKKSPELFLKKTSINDKKKILVLLAHCGTAEAYRIIEDVVRGADSGLRDYALLALHECRMFLENTLLGADSSVIATGLGGKGSKLRYSFVICSKSYRPFTEAQKNIIKNKFASVCQGLRSDIELIGFKDNYSKIKVLIPMDIAVARIIEDGISECNEKNEIVHSCYYVTNITEPTKEEIDSFLKGIINHEGRKK